MRERPTLFNLLQSIGLDLRACSLYPGLLLCSTTVVILAHLRNTLKSERIGCAYVNPNLAPSTGSVYEVHLHPTNSHHTRHSAHSVSFLASYQSFSSVSL